MSDGLEEDSKFMNLYSRQIGAYGMETMQKVGAALSVVDAARHHARPRPRQPRTLSFSRQARRSWSNSASWSSA